MAQKYKLCDCGHLNIFEETETAPNKCEKCTRKIMHKSIFRLEDYKPPEEVEEKKDEETVEDEDEGEVYFTLVNDERGIEIVLPEEDFILGREGVGASVLPATVSRKHLYVTPKGRMGIRITDKGSLNGTLVAGKVLPKDTPKIVLAGQTITLDVNSTGITLTLKRSKKAKEE